MSARPQGTIRPKCERFVATLKAKPWLVTHREMRTPMAASFSSPTQTPVNPSDLNPQVPPPVDWVVQKALAKDVEDRFSSAREFQAALYNAIPDAPADNAGADQAAPLSGAMNAARKLRTIRLAQGVDAPAMTAGGPA